MTDKKLGVGLIGLGAISNAHEAGYADFQDACRIVAMCDVNVEEAGMRAGMYEAHTYTDYRKLLEDPAVEMVDITTPHELHYEIAKAALEKGKHVLVEKPICVRSHLGAELVGIAQKAGVKLSVAENTPFVKAYQAAEQILKNGTLGEIWFVRTMIAGSEVYRLQQPELWHGKLPYGGVILDSAVHNFYLYKWLFGGAVDALGFADRFTGYKQAEENGLILGKLANGARYELFTSCVAEIPWTERLEIYGSKGGMIVDQLANPVVKYYLGSSDIDGTLVEGVDFDPLGWKFNSMVAEVKDFVTAVREDRTPRVDPWDAVQAVKMVEAVEESLRLKQPVSVE
jgi:UDP-N-acetyl-2-amino-2-deoxyglucuronate dehydrogenase